ncbi:MAG: carboxymuconolactone decarboxylase family protein [Planctomycetota bacterium]|jgi:alkylhydroperoxidase family enzyme
MAWIKTVATDEAEGSLRRFYDAAIQRAGRVFGIVRMMSPQPKLLQASMAFYQPLMQGEGALPRWQRELLAVIVSRSNACHY